MWSQAVDLADEAARLHRRFLRYQGPAEGAVTWEPPVDVHEGDDGALTLNFALPGVAPENIEIRLERGALTVSALRAPRVSGCGVIRRLEIPYGRFVRRVALSGPAVRIADSRYLNGCLEIRLVSCGTHEK